MTADAPGAPNAPGRGFAAEPPGRTTEPDARPPGPGGDRERRWRMVLGGGDADAFGLPLSGDDRVRDDALAALYGSGEGSGGDDTRRKERGGLGASSPRVARWLGDIRAYFPTSVVQVMQRDAMDRLGLRQLLLEPELLASVQPDVHLVGTLLSLNRLIPEQSRETARQVVRTVVDDLEARLASPMQQAMRGALARSARTQRPRLADVDWNRTIRANLRHYQPDLHTIVPERLIGFGRRAPRVERRLVLCLDQSGSMASSVVYASVFAAALASVRALRTHVIAFDTAVVDLTEELADPVDLLFGTQLGGGTDIGPALAYAESLITDPSGTVLVLISDLFDGGDPAQTLGRCIALAGSGVQVVVLLALSDDGTPVYSHDLADALGAAGIPVFACTPDLFADLMATAIQRGDVSSWAGRNDIALAEG